MILILVTSRPQKPSEQNGKEYVFLTREKMEQDIVDGKFIEHGEYKGNLYGTSAESVESIVNSGKHYTRMKSYTNDIYDLSVHYKRKICVDIFYI